MEVFGFVTLFFIMIFAIVLLFYQFRKIKENIDVWSDDDDDVLW